jgi:MoaA/NifB/PqqE/SkfB family radical SAM enzyme
VSARTPPLVLVPQYFGSTVFDRRSSRYMPFDAEATALLRASLASPFDHLIDREPDRERRDALERFFEDFHHRGFFTARRTFDARVLDVAPPADHLTGPLAVHLEVVASCNLTCGHCFAGPLPRAEPPLALDELDRLFASLAAMGSFRLGLTGGEPLMRRDLLEVLDRAVAHGLHPCLTTNGLLLTESLARELGARPLVWLNVSLEGATAETNDRVRGAGTFERVMRVLPVLARHARFTLAFTVMSSNLTEIRACAELAERTGASNAVFRPLYPVGTAVHHPELSTTFEEYSGAVDELAALADLRDMDPFGPRAREEAQSRVHENAGCGAGNLVCSISVSGDVNPCSFLGPDHAAGNVRRTAFEDIWHASAGFVAIRGLPGDGGTATFGGGSRARSRSPAR